MDVSTSRSCVVSELMTLTQLSSFCSGCMFFRDVEGNPLTQLQPNSLPESLTALYILDAKLPKIPAGALPLSIITLYVFGLLVIHLAFASSSHVP